MHKHFSKFLQSVVVIPLLATSFAVGPYPGIAVGSPSVAVISPDQNRTLADEAADNKQLVLDQKAAQLEAFFAKYNLPMKGYGKKLVMEADKNGLQPLDVAVVMGEESTFCKFIIPNTNNCAGLGGGKIRFKSIDEGIEVVAAAISGHDPKTAKYYQGQPMDKVLQIYNGNANHNYLRDIKSLKAQIESQDVELATVAVSKA